MLHLQPTIRRISPEQNLAPVCGEWIKRNDYIRASCEIPM